MMRKGPAYPGIGDAIVLGLAVGCSVVFLAAGDGFRQDSARFLRRTALAPFRLAMEYAPARLERGPEDVLRRRQDALCALDRAVWREAVRENARLRNLLGFADRAMQTLVPSEVIGRSVDRFGETLVLAGGERAGFGVGQTVVDVSGLVGVISIVEPDLSYVRTWRHDGLTISGMLQDSRYVGRLHWDRRRRSLSLEGIPLQSQISEREWVVTSGYGGIFPRGIPMGEVAGTEDDSTGLVKRVTVTPFVDLDRAEEVFLLVAEADSVDLPSGSLEPPDTGASDEGLGPGLDPGLGPSLGPGASEPRGGTP